MLKKMNKDLIIKINSAVEKYKKEIIKFALNLIRQLSENPPGDERNVAELIIKKSLEWNLPNPKILYKKIKHPNLIFNVRGKSKGKILILNGHIDTKPIGDINEWKIDPREPKIYNDRIYGLGASDMKGGVVGLIAAIMVLKYCNIPINGQINLILTSDEEKASEYGSKFLVEKGVEGDAVLVAEPSGLKKDFDSISIASKGTILGKVNVYGTQMHSSLSGKIKCINASIKMAYILLEFAENLKNHLYFKPHYLYADGPIINPGVLLEGGICYGVIPGFASFGFDIRTIPGMSSKVVKRDIEMFLKKLKERDKDLNYELIFEKWSEPFEISENHEIVNACTEATKIIIGTEPEKVGFMATTDGNLFANILNIPTIASFGPGLIELAHKPNEYISTKSILDASKIFALSIINYLNS